MSENRAARILHGIEQLLDDRRAPVPPKVMQAVLRVARGALEGPMTAERQLVEDLVRQPPAHGDDGRSFGERVSAARLAKVPAARRSEIARAAAVTRWAAAPTVAPEEKLAARRKYQAAWRREKLAKSRAAEKQAAKVEVAAEVADAAAEAADEAEKEAAAIAEAERADAAFEARQQSAEVEPAAPAPKPAPDMHGSEPAMQDSAPPMHDSPPAGPVVLAPPPPAAPPPAPPAATPRNRAEAAELRRQVQSRRAAEGLTWDALAARLGLSRASLSGWMSGNTSAAMEQRLRDWLATQPAPIGSTAREATPPAPGTLEAVPATLRTAQDWLYEELLRERGKRANHAELEAALAQFTPRGLFAEVNRRRLAHGLSPYSLAPRAGAGGA